MKDSLCICAMFYISVCVCTYLCPSPDLSCINDIHTYRFLGRESLDTQLLFFPIPGLLAFCVMLFFHFIVIRRRDPQQWSDLFPASVKNREEGVCLGRQECKCVCEPMRMWGCADIQAKAYIPVYEDISFYTCVVNEKERREITYICVRDTKDGGGGSRERFLFLTWQHDPRSQPHACLLFLLGLFPLLLLELLPCRGMVVVVLLVGRRRRRRGRGSSLD